MNLKNLTMLGAAAATCLGLYAGQGAPHTLRATANFGDVTLTWKAPQSAKQLKWHDGTAYNGDDGKINDAVHPVTTFWAGSRFTAGDLTAYAGDKVTAISFYQYRPVIEAVVCVFEDGNEVARATADPALYAKDKMITVALDEAVEIKPGKEYRFAVRFTAGYNMDMVAIKDAATAVFGRGDQISYDGKKWYSNAGGDYLVTAELLNDADEAPTGYTVNCSGALPLNVDADATTATFASLPDGEHTLTVEAVYDGAKVASRPCTVATTRLEHTMPDANWASASVTDLDVALAWNAPLLGGGNLTWGNPTMGLAIGGTATSNTKVWIKNEFAPGDLVAFAGAKIEKVRAYFAEPVTSVTVWVMEDGVFKASKTYAQTDTEAGWYEYALDEPYQLQPGHAYTYGLYLLHAPKTHPVGVSSAATVDTKGNMFSTSSPNSTDFLKSKPSWKTLRSGGMEGNWMLEAVLGDAPAALEAPVYDLYRDGTLVKAGLEGTSFDDTVDRLGTYTYTVVARNASRTAAGASRNVTVKLPAAYTAPVITGTGYDPETRTVSLAWTNDKELTKAGTPAYMVGFDEDLDMMWGQTFSAAELAAYQGYELRKLMVAIGESTGDLTVGVYTTKGEALSEITLPGSAVEPLAVYTVNLPVAVTLDGSRDLVFAYKASVKGGKSPIILDGGPLADGGARVSLTGGVTWMNLGTVNPAYNNYNVFISGLASTAAAKTAAATVAPATVGDLAVVNAAVVDRAPALSAIHTADYNAPAHAQAAVPVVKQYDVYRNGQLLESTTAESFAQQLDGYGVFDYNVRAVYTNGWESAASSTFTVSRHIDQKATAPYGLTCSYSAGTQHTLDLSWEHPSQATVLTYAPNDNYLGLGMTGTNPTSHVANKFDTETLKPHVGQYVSHIQFCLYTPEVTSLSVIVMYGENIVYKQEVPVSSLVAGLNDVRLSHPVPIPEGTEVGVGYVTKYPTGVKPLGMTDGVADAGMGDLISSSAAAGYWYSLKTKFKMDHNFWIKAILTHGDSEIVPVKDAADVTYNVYCDNAPIATGLSANSHRVTAPLEQGLPAGTYHVTAVDATGNESGESNKVTVARSAVNDIVADGALAPAEYFDLQGRRVINPAPGTTVICRRGNTITKVVF